VRSLAREAGRQYARGWGQPQVAMVVGLPEHRPDGERDANARLIAAAPALLAALKQMVASAVPNPDDHPSMTKAWKVAEAAIAKAEGKS
jgi:hypothetical protein